MGEESRMIEGLRGSGWQASGVINTVFPDCVAGNAGRLTGPNLSRMFQQASTISYFFILL